MKNTNFINNIARYLTFAGQEKDVAILDEDSLMSLLICLEDLNILSSFLMLLIENGRKMDVVDKCIESFKKFHQFLLDGYFLPHTSTFDNNVKKIRTLFHPIVLFQMDRQAHFRQSKSEELEKYSPDDLSMAILELH